jgi:elongation factor G
MVDSLRTLGIVAHIDAGKTTLTERILFQTGARRFVGEVDEGTTAMDWMRQEQERGISILAAATRVNWRQHDLQIVDTPGHIDFTAEVARSLRVVDAVVVVIDAVRGVESQTRAVWGQADHWLCARLVFVNKMDRPGADFDLAVRSLVKAFDCQPVPVAVPLFDAEGVFAGIGEPLTGTVIWFRGEIPVSEEERLARQLDIARERMIELCADFDEHILAEFVAGSKVSDDALVAVLRRGCIEGRIVPVLAGAALLGHGVEELLDAVCAFLPSPRDRNRQGLETAFPPADVDAPLQALVFKVEHEDAEVRSFVRVFAGRIQRGSRVRNSRTGAQFEVEELWAMHANHHAVIDSAGPGAVVVVPGVRVVQTGDTLFDEGFVGAGLPMADFPLPVMAAVFEPQEPDSRLSLDRALAELRDDDSTLKVSIDSETGLPLVAGMGELHLEVVAERVRERTGCNVRVGRPRVACRVTVLRATRASATVSSPGGGARASAEVSLSPLAETESVIIDVQAIADSPFASRLYLQLEQLVADGGPFGAPPARLCVTVHRVETDQGAEGASLLSQAVLVALQKAVEESVLQVLEPAVDVAVQCPEESLSVVLDDLHLRGAVVRQVSSGRLGSKVQARGALSSFLGYPTRLRSLTKGRGDVSLAPAGLSDGSGSDKPAGGTQN